jgi:NitT/TauT family transport system permease protein
MAGDQELLDTPHSSSDADGSSTGLTGPPTAQPGPPRRWGRPKALRLGGEVKTWQFVITAAAVFALLLVAWIVVTALELVNPLFLPGPTDVASRLFELGEDGTLWGDASVSIYRIMVGFVIATVMAVPLGIVMGTYRFWEAVFEPLTDFIRYMPVVAFIPLTIIWVGTDDSQKFVVIWIGTFFQQVLMVQDAVKRTPQDFVDIGRTLGMSERSILTRIVTRSSAPAIWDAMRITLGWAWTYLTLAELVAASSGLGYRITVAQRFFQTETIIGYILVLGLLGLLTDQLMKAGGRRLFPWARA